MLAAAAEESGWFGEYVVLFDLAFCQSTLTDLRRYFYDEYQTESRQRSSRSGFDRRGLPVSMGPRIDRLGHHRVKEVLDRHRDLNDDGEELRILRMLKYFEKYPPHAAGPVAPWADCLLSSDGVEAAKYVIDVDTAVVDVDSVIIGVLKVKAEVSERGAAGASGGSSSAGALWPGQAQRRATKVAVGARMEAIQWTRLLSRRAWK